MFKLSAKRDFVNAVSPSAVTSTLADELTARGAAGITRDGNRFRVTGLRVRDHNTPPLHLDDLVVQYYEGTSSGLSYDALARVHYSGSYLALWALPCVLAIAYAVFVSPVVLLLLPLGAFVIRALLPFVGRMWFEELFHNIERKALLLDANTGA